MKKKCLFIALTALAIACFCLAGCSNAYYGTYRGGLGDKETLTINKTIKNENYEYDYEINDTYLKLINKDSKAVSYLYSFENGNILAYKITYSFDMGSIDVKDGYFDASLYKLRSDFSLMYSYIFSSNGTYRYVDPVYPLGSHSGSYELIKGVLRLTGATSLGNSVKEIFYVKSPNLLYYGVYVKDGFLTSSSQNNNNNQGENDSRGDEEQKQTYTITYSAGEGGKIQGSASQIVIANGNGTSVTAVPYDGYEFAGWSDGATTATRQETNVTSNIYVTASFRKKQFYSITFVSYDDNNSQQSTQVEKNSQVKLPEPNKTGYSFKGWRVGNETKQAGDVLTVTQNVTAYATWEINTYSITYNLNGGTLKDAKTQFTIRDLPLTLQFPEGKTEDLSFAKWSTDENGEKEITVIGKSKENLKDFTLYAFYEDSSNFFEYKYDSENQGYTVTGFTGNAKRVTVPSTYRGVAVIGLSGAFKKSKIVSVTIPEGLTYIEDSFQSCYSLSEIIIPEGVTKIDYSFQHCTSLSEVIIPEGVTEICWSFTSCASLSEIIIPEGVTRISSSFISCTSLSEVIIPEGVTEIYYSFQHCASLIEIIIPEGVTRISSSFISCTSLSEVIIPEGVTEIYSSFQHCTSLSEVIIPEGVTEIYSSFQHCASLSEVIILGNNTGIYNNSFEDCKLLKTVYTCSSPSVNGSNLLFDYAETVYISKDVTVTNTLFTVVFEKESEDLFNVNGVDYYKYILKR